MKLTARYITTPIYYVNDRPHLGTTYSTVAVDVMSRYHQVRGRPARMLTGLDEHGQKIERRAQEEALAPQEFADRMAPPFRSAWDLLECAYDDFIRTTEERHRERAQELWRRMQAAGDIYVGDYEAWYCVGCEAFYTEKDLDEGNQCPIHRRPVERVKEQSYFFKLSDYQEKLLAFYEAHPQFVRPESRFNEVKSFVREGLHDISISRTSFRWGIPIPNDPTHVMYVWVDALTNYISALGAPTKADEHSPLFEQFWPPNGHVTHVVGKDILRFHAIFWPAYLMSAGLEAPSQVWAHGWLTVNGEKMSKSLGNFLPPEPLVEVLGADVLRYYLMRDIAFGQDGDFSHVNLLARYQGELCNGLGNLLHRIVSIVKGHLDGRVPFVDLQQCEAADRELIDVAKKCALSAREHYEVMAPHRALETIWELIAAANRYVDQTAPWALAKQKQHLRLKQVCYTVLEALRWISVMCWPVMPSKANELRAQLGLGPLMPTAQIDLWPSAWGALVAGTPAPGGQPLFARYDKQEEQHVLARLGYQAATKPQAVKRSSQTSSKGKTMQANAKDTITIDDFIKLDVRIGEVKTAERVPKSDKLLRLMIDVGESEPRQILAGIGQHYAPEHLVGKRLAVLVNLPARKMMGMESQGMVLAASDASGLSVLAVDKDLKIGSKVS